MHDQYELLRQRELLTKYLYDSPYSAFCYLCRAQCYRELQFPDLAAGDAYKALLLTDEIQDESGEYHEQAVAAYEEENERETTPIRTLVSRIYGMIAKCLSDCGSHRSAFEFVLRGLRLESGNTELEAIKSDLLAHCRETQSNDNVSSAEPSFNPLQDLNGCGMVRRELYPWNNYESDRLIDQNVRFLDDELSKVAPKISARAVELPELSTNGHGKDAKTSRQLGLFANADISPGEVLLEEYSLLTANNRLHDPLCDACSTELPAITPEKERYVCPECETTVFCSRFCLEAAMTSYHPAVCGAGVDALARETDAKDSADALYLLLVGRAMAMAETKGLHPLELKEIKFLWGDFAAVGAAPSLPFRFEYNILYPLNILEKMDVDIFKTLPQYDFWILNTLFAKFRGVASGRVDPRTGRPEVCAVHPLWCLANHSCAPNVKWEWGGSIKFWARSAKEMVRWREDRELLNGNGHWGGIKKGEEILNHYCDVMLDVQSRREWANGVLGGNCKCPRCCWEAGETP